MTDPADLLAPEFVRQLELLRRRLRIDVRSGASGEHVARRRGASAEFREHRPYASGDDLRRVDWLAFARTGEPVVKLFHAEEDAIFRLVLDASASLSVGDPSKFEVARRLTAAIGYLALVSGQRTQLLVARSGDPHDPGRGLSQLGAPRRGRGSLANLLRELAQLDPSGTTDLGRSIEQALHAARRPGFLVVVSDFLDPGPFTEALSRARAAGHQVALVQVLTAAELEPDFTGDVTLVDAETGATVDVSLEPAAAEAYMLRIAGLAEELRAWARKHGASYVRTLTDQPLDLAITRFAQHAID